MPTKEVHAFYISTGTMIRFFTVLLGILMLYVIRDILASLFFAIIIASAVEPAIDWFKEKKISRIPAVILIYLFILTILFLLVYLIFPIITEEFQHFYATYPQLQKRLLSELQQWGISSYISFLGGDAGELLNLPSQYFEQFGNVFDFASAIFGGVTTFILIIVFSFYLAAQEKGIEKFLRLVVPLQYEPYLLDLWDRSRRKLGVWLRTQMLLGALVGVLIFFGLTFLGIRQPFLLAVIAGVFEIIPIVGPILAAVPAVGIAFLSSPLLGLFTIILYVVIQQLESHVIVPVVMKRAVDLSPLIVVIALLVGAKLGGIFGILLAVPLTAIAAEFLNDWDKKKRELMPG